MSVRQTTLHAPAAVQLPAGTLLQRKCACGSHTSGEEECEECKRMQRRAASADDDEFEIPPIVGRVLSSPGRPLDAQVRQQMEAGFGHDFHDVRVHTDETAQRSARSVNALAYTVGRNVVFGGGQYAPGSQHGMHLLAHELAHVVQQRGQVGGLGGVGRSNALMEHEADSAAARIVSGQMAPAMAAAPGTLLARHAVPAASSSKRSLGACQVPEGSASSAQQTPDNVGERKAVQMKDGRRYIVNRKPWSETSRRPVTRTNTKPGIDRRELWLEFKWCRGSNSGSVRAAANVPEAALKLLRDSIANGGDVNKAWASATVTPSLGLTFRFGNFDLGLGGNLTIGSGGNVQGGGVTARFSSDKFLNGTEIQVSGQGGSNGGNVIVGVGIPLGKKAPPERCDEEWVRAGYEYKCRRVHEVPATTRPGQQSVEVLDERDYNLFFEHATDVLRVADNKETLRNLRADLEADFQVHAIEGWTSPEGPMESNAKADSAKDAKQNGKALFKGNDALSERRAKKAWDVAISYCPAGTGCIVPGVQPEGKGERMDPVDPVSGQRRDVRGAELEEYVDTHFADDPAEASVQSSKLSEDLSRTRSRKQRVEMMYRWLRRAVVRIRRTTLSNQECKVDVPATTREGEPEACPDDVRREAYPDRAGGL